MSKTEKTCIAFAAFAFAAVSVVAATPSERYVAEARRLYPTADYVACTNSVVKSYAKPAAWEKTHAGETGLNWIVVRDLYNVRDLGGWNGLKTGAAYRGSQLFRNKTGKVSVETKTKLSELGIRTDLDLRLKDEEKDVSWTLPDAVPSIRRVNVYVTPYTGAFFDNGTNAWRQILKVFTDDRNYPIYFHCKVGADRTGTLAFLLAGLCGASETDLAIDYELTSFSGIGAFRLRYGTPASQFGKNVFREMLDAVKALPGAELKDRFAAFVKTLGLTDADIAVIRRHFAPDSSIR